MRVAAVISKILGFVGMFMLIGLVGTTDRLMELGIYDQQQPTLLWLIAMGLALQALVFDEIMKKLFHDNDL